MGDSLSHELSMHGVDTGRRLPDQQMPTIDYSGGAPNITTQNVPGAPIMRPSFLQAFLANLGPALAGGMAASPGHPFGTGLGGAMAGIQSYNQQQFERQLQTGAAQRAQQQSESAIAYQKAELNKIQQETPIDVETKRVNLDLLKGQVAFYGNPDNLQKAADDAFKSFGPLEPDEQANKDAAVKDAQLKRSFDPIRDAVKGVYQNRAMGSRAGPSSVIEDSASGTGFSKVIYDKTGKNILQVQKDYAAPGLIARTGTSQKLVQDAQGNWNLVNVTSSSGPTVPKSSAAPTPVTPGAISPPAAAPTPGVPATPAPRTSTPAAVPRQTAKGPKITPLGIGGPTSIDAGYAYDPKANQTVLTTRGEFAGQGLLNFRKVTQGQIENDRQLNNRLADVQQKMNRYSDSFSKDLSAGDLYVLNKLASDQHFEAAFKPFGVGVTIPTDVIVNLDKAAQANGLSKDGVERLNAYLNAREAMVGYQRVLSGSGRGNEAQMKMLLQTLPGPILNRGVAQNAFDQFQQNLTIAGQGLPKLPGVTSPGEIENQQKKAKGKWNPLTGRYE